MDVAMTVETSDANHAVLQRVIASKVQRVKQMEDGCRCDAVSSMACENYPGRCGVTAHYLEI
jgi:hypothetical protein